ncbi:MAG: succinate dehydrogenase assembly factor 2 [Pseudomonadales bacterium]|nr:succinate dehydrogenase assembly factor 2 [Pseudomonadales bacterium]
MNPKSATAAERFGRLTWSCRRGMRELDVLLERYLREHYRHASSDERAAFERILGLQDPELARYLLAGDEPIDPDIARIVAQISPRPST